MDWIDRAIVSGAVVGLLLFLAAAIDSCTTERACAKACGPGKDSRTRASVCECAVWGAP